MAKKKITKKKSSKPRKASPPKTLGGVSVPAAYGTVNGARSMYPMINQVGGKCLIKNFEQLNVFPTGNTAFQASGALTNPGIAGSFPWLYSTAQAFQKFRILYMRFFYSGSCPTSTTGKVWIQVCYDGADNAPTTLSEVLASEFSSAGPAWYGGTVSNNKAFDKNIGSDSNIYVDVDCSKFSEPYYYVRDSTNTIGVSLTGIPTGGIGTLALAGSTIDPSAVPCRVYYGNNGVTSTTVPGELYVAYVIELLEPIAVAQGI